MYSRKLVKIVLLFLLFSIAFYFIIGYDGLPWSSVRSPSRRYGKQGDDVTYVTSHIESSTLETNTKVVTVDCSNYQTKAIDTYDVVSIDGFDLSKKQSKPVVPVKQIRMNIPLNATVDNIDVTFTNANTLGDLNIPAYQLPPPMPGEDFEGEYIDCSNDLGVYPPVQYAEKNSEMVGYQTLDVRIYPLIYDTALKQATIYQNVSIQVTYTTPNQGFVQNFTPDKRDYSISKPIITTTEIENTSGGAVDFSATVQVKDLAGNVISSKTGSKSIASNSTGEIGVNLITPGQSGLYRLVCTASDGVNTIGTSMQDIDVETSR